MKQSMPYGTEPPNWDDLLKNFLIIAGVGKSGLTWVTSLVGTLEYTYRLNCPSVLKMVPVDTPISIIHRYFRPIFRSSIIHDHCCQVARGIYVSDDINTMFYSDWAWATSKDRLEETKQDRLFNYTVLRRLRKEYPLFVTDITEGIAHHNSIKAILPESTFLYVVRNGLHVVTERVAIQWDTDRFYNSPCLPTVGWIDGKSPWFVSEEAKQLWPTWTTTTRASHIWRIQTEAVGDNPYIFYEDFVERPDLLVEKIEDEFSFTKRTPITSVMEKKIKAECPDRHGTDVSFLGQSNIEISDIQEPERARFKHTMEKFDYL